MFNLMNVVKGISVGAVAINAIGLVIAGGAVCAIPAAVAVVGVGTMLMLSDKSRSEDWDYGFNKTQLVEWKEEDNNKDIIWEDEVFTTEMLWTDEEGMEEVGGICWWEEEMADIDWNKEIVWEDIPNIEWEELI